MLFISNKGYWQKAVLTPIIVIRLACLKGEITLNNGLILLCCAVLIAASLLTNGLVRALIDLGAFSCLLGLLVWRHSSQECNRERSRERQRERNKKQRL